MATGEINEALSAMGAFAQSLRKSTRQYSSFIDEMERNNAGSKNDRRELIEREKNIKATEKATKKLEKLSKKAQALEMANKTSEKSNKQAAKSIKTLAKRINEVAPNTYNKAMMDSLDKLSKTSGNTDSAFGTLNRKINENIKLSKRDRSNKVADLRRTYEEKFATNDKIAALKQSTKHLYSFDKGITIATTLLIQTISQVEKAQKHQVGMYSALSQGTESAAYSMSLAPSAMQDFVNSNKQLILATKEDYDDLGDAVGNTVGMLTKESKGRQSLIDKTFDLTGSYEDSAALLGNTMSMLRGAGEQVGLDVLGEQTHGLVDTFGKLGRLSGKSAKEISSMTMNFTQSEAIRTKIQRLSDVNRRRQYIKSIADEALRNKKLGISINETFQMIRNAAASGERQVIDKVVQSYTLTQSAAMLGMSTSNAKRFGELSKLDRTKPETEEFRKLGTEYKSREMKLLSSRDPSIQQTAIAFQSFAKELNGALATELNTFKIGLDSEGKRIKDSDADKKGDQGILAEGFGSIVKWWKGNIQPALADPIGAAVWGAGTMITAAILGGKLLSGLSKILPKSIGNIFKKSKGFYPPKASKLGPAGLAKKGLFRKTFDAVKSIVPKFDKSLLSRVATPLNFMKTVAKRHPAATAFALGGIIGTTLVNPLIKFFDKFFNMDVWGFLGKTTADAVGVFDSVVGFFKSEKSDKKKISTPSSTNMTQVVNNTTTPATRKSRRIKDHAVGAAPLVTPPDMNMQAAMAQLNLAMTEHTSIFKEHLEATKQTNDSIGKVTTTIKSVDEKQSELIAEQTDVLKENEAFGAIAAAT